MGLTVGPSESIIFRWLLERQLLSDKEIIVVQQRRYYILHFSNYSSSSIKLEGIAVDKFKVNDILITENRVFKVKRVSHEHPRIPDGWLRDVKGRWINPKFCREYKGAESVLEGNI